VKYTTNIPRQMAEKVTKNTIFPFVDTERPTVLISINEPEKHPSQLIANAWDEVLRCAFWDVTRSGLVPDLRDTSKFLDTMTEEEAVRIAEFINRHRDSNIVVHCHAGISRSAAVARLLAEMGWLYKPVLHDFSGYNIHVYSLLKKQFPDMLPIGL
jgi:predicted protein tyrosine phosphatase